ncbi:hypothetical protein [Actinoplanes couchii]|uniref:Uncharacterized protein n=1 Tax=Actinoplanes couchii TaxID=403638 RepID=A0ABQ3XRB0_9ACTN|nr:hypothetical protein [Actinoplanes couchii]MDR6320005.1 hypothetical protein [Actinoplanes couchii]GID61045.1 hypothetical protein Aco03nite_094490 [Actinoplanes couchii]
MRFPAYAQRGRQWVAGAWTRVEQKIKTTRWRRYGEMTTVLAACLALIISVWTASAGNERADRTRVDELKARLRDDMSKLGELDVDLRGTESERNAAAIQLGVWSAEAWEIINEIGPDRVSPIDLALTAQSLALSALYEDAEKAIGIALQRRTNTDVRLLLLNSAVSVYYQTGELAKLRAAAGEVVAVQTARYARLQAEGNGYANLGATDVARAHFTWSYAEASYRNCAVARDHYEKGLAISRNVNPPLPILSGREQYAQGGLKEHCPGVLPD